MPSNNKDYMRKYMKEYTKKSKEIDCECGNKYKEHQKYNHMKTQKHLNGMNKQEKVNLPNVNELLERIKKLESLCGSGLKTSGV